MVLSSFGCKVPWALRGGCGSSEQTSHGSETSIALCACRFFNCAALLLLSKPKPLCWVSVLKRRAAYAEETKHNLLRFPGAGSKFVLPPVAERPHRGLSAILPRKRRFLRPGERRQDEKVWAHHGRIRHKDLPDAGSVRQTVFTGYRSRRWCEIRATT